MNELSRRIGCTPPFERDLALGGVSRPIGAEPDERAFETVALRRADPLFVSVRRTRVFEPVR